MFFTSYEFLFIFAPLAFIGFCWLQSSGRRIGAEYWLIALSLFFYWSLDGDHVVFLLVSVLVNYLLSVLMRRYRRAALTLLWVGIVFNIAFLVWFKYSATWFGPALSTAIPLGISFFSLQQIAYLVSAYSEDDAPPLRRYLMFVSFFPYVVAGPIVMKQEVMSQYDQMSAQRSLGMLLPAVTVFSMGLFKKVVFADNIGPHVDEVFNAAGQGVAITSADAWGASALFALQLYFDFSGYADMAAGLAALFGIHLPRNFHSPLKASSIMEFWRRWHMSATRFFTNFLYMPLVVVLMRKTVRRRLGAVSRYAITTLLPMLATFVLIGIWHGAGVNAAIFGLMMGVALSVNHVWIKLERPSPPPVVGWLLTMFVVVIGMVFARADDFGMAVNILRAMAGAGTAIQPLLDYNAVAWLAGLGAIALLAPNTHEIMAKSQIVLHEAWDTVAQWYARFQWSTGTWGVGFTSLIFSLSIVSIPKAAQFLYYRF